tara:strand:+ start:114 stop:317 length:204 start_codon:yes stop_codon:yes gene_type:complete
MELLATGMAMGAAISIISIYCTMLHIIKTDKNKVLSGHYDVEIKNKGNYIKTDVVLTKKRGTFYARG